MTYDDQTTIKEFLAGAAAKQPSPGGGSVAALTGALAATMGEMVLNYSVGKKNLAEYHERLKVELAQFTRARFVLVELMVEDQAAYEALTAARKTATDSPTDQKQLADLVQICIAVPMTIAVAAYEVLELAEAVAGRVNPFLLSDLAVCADLAMATVRCASYNVIANVPELPTDAAKAKARADIDELVAKATATVQRASAAIWSHPSRP